MPNRKTSLWFLCAALLFVAFVLNVTADGDMALRAILDPARANASDWRKGAWILLSAVGWICFGLAGYLEFRKSSVGS